MGVLFERGFNQGAGVNKFRPEGAKFFTFFIKKYTFLYCLKMNYYVYCLLNMLIFTIFKLQMSQFKITQLLYKKDITSTEVKWFPA